MYLYFDRQGNLNEQINDEAIRQGNQNINKLYIFWEDAENRNTLGVWYRFVSSASDGFSIPKDVQTPIKMSNTTVTQTIPYDPKRDLKYFKYSQPYKFYVVDFENDEDVLNYGNVSWLASLWFVVDKNDDPEDNQITVEDGEVISYDDSQIDVIGMGAVAFFVAGVVQTIVGDENISLAQWNYLIGLYTTWEQHQHDLDDKITELDTKVTELDGTVDLVIPRIEALESAITTKIDEVKINDVTQAKSLVDNKVIVSLDLSAYATNLNLKTYAKSLEVSINQSTYIATFNLKDADGNIISTQTLDFPIESMVVSGSYDSQTKSIILTLQNGNTTSIPVGDLVDGLVSNTQLTVILGDYYTKTQVYNKTEMDGLLNGKASALDLVHLTNRVGVLEDNSAFQKDTTTWRFNAMGELDLINGSRTLYIKDLDFIEDANGKLLSNYFNEKQDTLIGIGTGQNIKSINGSSILGSSNLNLIEKVSNGYQTITNNKLTPPQAEALELYTQPNANLAALLKFNLAGINLGSIGVRRKSGVNYPIYKDADGNLHAIALQPDNYNIKEVVSNDSDQIRELEIQDKTDTYTIVTVKAPDTQPKEATACLKVENSGTNNDETYFMDISVMNYGNVDEEPEESIYLQSRNASVKPRFNIGWTDETQTRHKKLIINPDALPMMFTSTGIWVKNTNDPTVHGWANRTEVDLRDINTNKTAIASINTALENKVDKRTTTENLPHLYAYGKLDGSAVNDMTASKESYNGTIPIRDGNVGIKSNAIDSQSSSYDSVLVNIEWIKNHAPLLQPSGVNQNYDNSIYQIYGHMPLQTAQGSRNALQYCFNVSNTPSQATIPQYDSNANLKSSTPVANNDVATKQYVDNNVPSNVLLKTDATTTATANKVVMRDGSGNIEGNYIQGTWLKTTGATEISNSWSDVFVNDGNGWLYKRSKANFKSDLGIPSGTLTTKENLTPTLLKTAQSQGYGNLDFLFTNVDLTTKQGLGVLTFGNCQILINLYGLTKGTTYYQPATFRVSGSTTSSGVRQGLLAYTYNTNNSFSCVFLEWNGSSWVNAQSGVTYTAYLFLVNLK